mgnify:CR=1 FL=1
MTADHAIPCMSFSVLRTLDTAESGFDLLKKTAVTKLGSGSQLEATAPVREPALEHGRPVGPARTARTYADTGYQNTWDVTRGQPGATGILVDYTGGDVGRGAVERRCLTLQPQTPRWPRIARRFLDQPRAGLPGDQRAWNGKATLSNPTLDPNLLRARTHTGSPGSTTPSAATKACGREHPLRRRALLAGLPGLHGGRRASEGSRPPTRSWPTLSEPSPARSRV